MASTLDVMVAGEIYVDLLMTGFNVWPQPGRESFASGFRREIGGGAAITASGLAKLGTHAGVLGTVGSDSGDWIIAELTEHGVDIGGIAIDRTEPTGMTVVATTADDRAMLTYAGANRRLIPLLIARAESSMLLHTRHVHLACAPHERDLRRLIQAIKRNGCTVSLDAGWHEDWLTDPGVHAALREVDLFFPNQEEARCLTGEQSPERILEAFRALGAPGVALKLGAQGAALLYKGEVFAAKPIAVEVVDTTGAGDCFDAGFLHAWLRGMPPDACLRHANICGALSTRNYGGIAGFPSPEEIDIELAR